MTDTTPSPVAQIVGLAVSAGLKASIDEPANHDGVWWVDLRRGDTHAMVEWKRNRGFGLYGQDAVFLSGPNHFVEDPAEALRELKDTLSH